MRSMLERTHIASNNISIEINEYPLYKFAEKQGTLMNYSVENAGHYQKGDPSRG